MRKQKIAVVWFNLGGPDASSAIRPFLTNMFNDRAIIDLPQPFRRIVAEMIARIRLKKARINYRPLGSCSPILKNSEEQALKLQLHLQKSGIDARCFVSMRYWKPFAKDVLCEIRDWGADQIILLSAYPQMSRVTVGSFVQQWSETAKKLGIDTPTRQILSYPVLPEMIEPLTARIKTELAEMGNIPVRLLFSAHGLPQKIIDRGDPYQKDAEATASAIGDGLTGVDWRICFQSKVGPMTWIGPSCEEEIIQAGKEGLALLVVPISFTAENSETLVELDIDYKNLAQRAGVKAYRRLSVIGADDNFISGLAKLVQKTLEN